MRLRLLLHSKFPDAQEDEILKVVGNLVYYRYMNPAIVAPDAFDIIDVGVDNQLTPEQVGVVWVWLFVLPTVLYYTLCFLMCREETLAPLQKCFSMLLLENWYVVEARLEDTNRIMIIQIFYLIIFFFLSSV